MGVYDVRTYKIPRPKTTVKAIFLREFNCSVQSMGIGRTRMHTSRVRLKMELRRNFMLKLPQCCRAAGPTSQLYLIGLQIAKKVIVQPTRYAIAHPSKK